MKPGNKNLLLIDDSRTALKFFSEQFTLYGYNVKTAQNEIELAQCLENFLPNCFVVDYEMEGIEGPDLTMKLKATPRTKHIPVVILTSKVEKKYLLNAINSGADDFVDKKIDPEVIVCKIRAVIRTSELLIKHLELERYRSAHAMITTYNHEINNPLAVAAGMLGEKLENLTQERFQNAHKALDRIRDVVHKIDELTHTTLKFEEYVAADAFESQMLDLKRKVR